MVETVSPTQQRNRQILVELNNVTKIFSRANWAIKKVNLKIYQQDAIAFVGKNGSGKTTLAQLIGNISKQTSGNIDYFFDNENVFQAIGYQSREQSWPVGFRVQDVMNLYLTAYEVKDKTWIAKLVDVFDIEEIKDKSLTKLNILSLQLFAIFLVMLYKPELLVIDEFSSSIAFEKKMKILNLLKEYRADGGTIVLVQPEDFILNALCNRIVTLNDGEIQADLTLKKVLKDYGSTFEYIRKLSLEAKNVAPTSSVNRGFEIIFRKYEEVQNSLEETYRTQFNNKFKSGDQELDLDIRNAIYYVDLGYESLLKSLNAQTTADSIAETVKILRRTVKFLRQTLVLFKKHHRDFHNDVRFKKVELEVQKTLYLIEKKILPILKNNQIFSNVEETESVTSASERQQLKILKRRYIREEVRIMKLEQRLKRTKKSWWNKKNPPVTATSKKILTEPLPEVTDVLQKQVDVTVVVKDDETIELLTNRPGQTQKLILANFKKIRKNEEKKVQDSPVNLKTQKIADFFDETKKEGED